MIIFWGKTLSRASCVECQAARCSIISLVLPAAAAAATESLECLFLEILGATSARELYCLRMSRSFRARVDWRRCLACRLSLSCIHHLQAGRTLIIFTHGRRALAPINLGQGARIVLWELEEHQKSPVLSLVRTHKLSKHALARGES